MASDEEFKAWLDETAARLVGGDENWWWIKTGCIFVVCVGVIAVVGAFVVIVLQDFLPGSHARLAARGDPVITRVMIFLPLVIGGYAVYLAARRLPKLFRDVRAHLESD
jgi:hypothetical protein